jgi:hypothetical protein
LISTQISLVAPAEAIRLFLSANPAYEDCDVPDPGAGAFVTVYVLLDASDFQSQGVTGRVFYGAGSHGLGLRR